MKTALSIWSTHKHLYDHTWTQHDFIDFSGTVGAEGVELLSIFWREQDTVAGIAEALRRNRLKLACFGACNNLAVADERKRADNIRDITDSVDKAEQLGAEVVRVFSGDKEKDVSFEEAKSWIIAGLKEAAAYAESKGIVLCLENHGYFAGRADQILEMIGEVGSSALRSTFDTGNFLLVDEDPNAAIGKLKPLVRHVHVKDFAKAGPEYEGHIYTSLQGNRYAGKAPGEGIVDLSHILRALKSANYSGWLTVEYEGDEEQKLGSSRSIENVKRIVSELA